MCTAQHTFWLSMCVPADFATGIYHWSVDNYGSGLTPLVGGQIAAFQGHHQRPWTITQRQVANNIHKVSGLFPINQIGSTCQALFWLATCAHLLCLRLSGLSFSLCCTVKYALPSSQSSILLKKPAGEWSSCRPPQLTATPDVLQPL